ncbi:MAG: hypothetical protein EHM42_06910, partial [Planctomycetaceae bacterium]
PPRPSGIAESGASPGVAVSAEGSARQNFRKKLREGQLDDKEIEIDVAEARPSLEIMGPAGMEEMAEQLRGLFSQAGQGKRSKRRLKISEAIKLLVEEEEHDVTPDNADQSALAAIKMIFIADFMMSLDNMLAVAGASHGDSMRLLLGLFVSIGIIMTCSGLIARLMNRFPWIVWLGTAILALTAAEMIMGDREVARFVVRNTGISLNKHWEHDYMTTSAELPKFDGISKLPEELHELTHFSDGHLHYIGQMTADHRDELLSVAAGDQERKAVEQIFELSHERAAPGWLPSVFSSLIQPKFPAELMQKVQGRQYHWVAYVFNVAVVVICMSTPFWLRRSASPEHLAGEPPADPQSS